VGCESDFSEIFDFASAVTFAPSARFRS